MSYQLNFERFLTYNISGEGIGLDVEIKFGEVSSKLHAKLTRARLTAFSSENSAQNSVWKLKAECGSVSARRQALFTATVFA